MLLAGIASALQANRETVRVITFTRFRFLFGATAWWPHIAHRIVGT
jgi:hypothetical protein